MQYRVIDAFDEAWEVAYFTSIQPSIAQQIGSKEPFLVNAIFESLDEYEIVTTFVDCCKKMGVSICEDRSGQHQLLDGNGVDCFDLFAKVFRKALSRKVNSEMGQEVLNP